MLSMAGPDHSKIGTDFSVTLGVVMEPIGKKVAICPPQVAGLENSLQCSNSSCLSAGMGWKPRTSLEVAKGPPSAQGSGCNHAPPRRPWTPSATPRLPRDSAVWHSQRLPSTQPPQTALPPAAVRPLGNQGRCADIFGWSGNRGGVLYLFPGIGVGPGNVANSECDEPPLFWDHRFFSALFVLVWVSSRSAESLFQLAPGQVPPVHLADCCFLEGEELEAALERKRKHVRAVVKRRLGAGGRVRVRCASSQEEAHEELRDVDADRQHAADIGWEALVGFRRSPGPRDRPDRPFHRLVDHSGPVFGDRQRARLRRPLGLSRKIGHSLAPGPVSLSFCW